MIIAFNYMSIVMNVVDTIAALEIIIRIFNFVDM